MRLTHSYPARQLPDGTFEIRDLDIFETCAREHPITGALDSFDREWLRAAAQAASRREADGYFAPVHLGHHGDVEEEPEFAGFLRDLSVLELGDESAVLRAAITGIPADVFARIRDRRIPYRSVEILDPAVPEISSLALLESTVPFFKFPITAVDLAPETAPEAASSAAMHAKQAGEWTGVHFEETDAGLRCVAQFAPTSFAANGGELAHHADSLIAAATATIETAHKLADELAHKFAATPAPEAAPEADQDAAARAAIIDRHIHSLAVGGFVFADDPVRKIADRAPDIAECFADLRRVLPCAPLAARDELGDAGRIELAPLTGDADADAVLRELGRSDEAVTKAAKAAVAEFSHLAGRFAKLGCSFSKSDFVRYRLMPVCVESR